MKNLIVALALISSFSALACQREAQFIGKVRNVQHLTAEAGQIEQTTFQIEVGNWYQPSMVCPLDDIEASEAVIKLDGYVEMNEGDPVSGVLVYKEEFDLYVIE